MSAFPKNERFLRLHKAGQGVMCLRPTESTALAVFVWDHVRVSGGYRDNFTEVIAKHKPSGN